MSSGDDVTLPGPSTTPTEDNASDDSIDTFLRNVAAAPAVKLPGRDPALAAGSIIDGAYRVLGLLGAGGMGTVYVAEHLELGRRVAIKLHRRHESEADNELLLREAKAMAQLAHPNVVTVNRAGTLDGQVYIAMEYVDGTTLTAWMRAERTWREVVNMFVEVSRGLGAAHAAGLIHRDFKPDNVLIDGAGRPRVADFGLAREVLIDASEAEAEATATAQRKPVDSDGAYHPTANAIAGTPAYMSPEQFGAEPLDARSDQYSFCVALYEALWGRRPCESESVFSLAAAVIAGQLRPPPPGVTPRWLESVVMRGLSVRASERHPSMDALQDALQRGASPRRRWRTVAWGVPAVALAVYASSRDEADPCATFGERLATAWGRAQADTLAERVQASGALAAQEYAAGVTRRLDAWATDWTASATEACEATRSNAPRADMATERGQACLRGAADRLAVIVESLSDKPALLPSTVDEALARLPPVSLCSDPGYLSLQADVTSDPTRRAQVESVRRQLARADVLTDLRATDSAIETATAAVATARAIGDRPVEAEALLSVGRAWYAAGDATQAEANLANAYFLATELGYEQLVVDTASYLVANAGVLGGRPEQAQQWARHAEAALARVGDYAPAREDLLSALGNFEFQRGNYERAGEHHRAVLALARTARPPDPAGVARALQNVALVLREQGEQAQSLDYLEQALAFESERPDTSRHNLASALHNIGVVLTDLGRGAEAEQRFTDALHLKEQWLGPEHPEVATTVDGLGGLLEARGDFEAAFEAFERSLRIRATALGPDHPEVADSHTNLANALDGLERREEAVTHHRRALDLVLAAYGPQHPRVGLVCNNLGYTLMQMERYEEARAMLERARDNWRAVLGDAHPLLAHPLTNLGVLAQTEGRMPDARAALEGALKIVESQTVESVLAGETRLRLAQVLWATEPDTTEPARVTRVRALLLAARQDLRAAGEAGTKLHAQLEQWARDEDLGDGVALERTPP